jgi:hypothetical protein
MAKPDSTPPNLVPFEVDLLEMLSDRQWERAQSLLCSVADDGRSVTLHPSTIKAIAHRLTDRGRQKSRGRQGDHLAEKLRIGEQVESELQGSSPAQRFSEYVRSREAEFPVPSEVSHGAKLDAIHDAARRQNVSVSKAEKDRAEYNAFLKAANEADPSDPRPREDPPEDMAVVQPNRRVGIVLASKAKMAKKGKRQRR